MSYCCHYKISILLVIPHNIPPHLSLSLPLLSPPAAALSTPHISPSDDGSTHKKESKLCKHPNLHVDDLYMNMISDYLYMHVCVCVHVCMDVL